MPGAGFGWLMVTLRCYGNSAWGRLDFGMPPKSWVPRLAKDLNAKVAKDAISGDGGYGGDEVQSAEDVVGVGVQDEGAVLGGFVGGKLRGGGGG